MSFCCAYGNQAPLVDFFFIMIPYYPENNVLSLFFFYGVPFYSSPRLVFEHLLVFSMIVPMFLCRSN